MLDNETGGWSVGVGEVGTVKAKPDPDRENRRDVRKANFMVMVGMVCLSVLSVGNTVLGRETE